MELKEKYDVNIKCWKRWTAFSEVINLDEIVYLIIQETLSGTFIDLLILCYAAFYNPRDK
jgi:hypothetical protein